MSAFSNHTVDYNEILPCHFIYKDYFSYLQIYACRSINN